ncbi:MAG TPA: acyltransferase, partial [Bacteroidales bacterium]|nr:acyltransferase [Bacteroidales bacterium]
ILLSLLVIDEQARWPGILTLIPVLGTMMILISSQQNSWFTRPKILQFLGNTSYSIYLWHWPVIFFSSYLAFSHSALNILLGVALSVFLGWLSYQWIEEPFRQKFSKQKLLSSYSFFIGSTLILLLGYYYIYKTEGVISRAPKSYLDKAAQMEMPSVKN